jgi:hypothetical protein
MISFLRHARPLAALFVIGALGTMGAGCPDPEAPTGGHCDTKAPRSELATKWLKRATEEYRNGDLAEASDSVGKAQKGAPCDVDVHMLAARIALAKLDYPEAIKALKDIDGSEAAGLRARAYWYSDDIAHTAEELSRALDDPDFKDPWAKPVRELAGTQGSGRKPFLLKEGGARLVEIRMPRDLGYALMVPCEIDGQATIALAVTGVPEVVLDTKGRSKPGWVSVKFGSGDRTMEFRDVPAMVQDLSSFTQQQAVPIGALLGVNFLRRMHLTFDRRADQFVIRREEPPVPPSVTKVPVSYVKAGGMVVRGTLKKEFEINSGLWINTGEPWTLALPDPTWKKIGVDVKTLATYAGLQHGKLNDVRVGGLDLGPVESIAGITGVDEKLKQLDVDVMGAMGVGFLTAMRVTLADGGRSLWLETDDDTSAVLAPSVPTSSPKPAATAPAPSSSTPAPKSSAPAPKSSAPPAPTEKPLAPLVKPVPKPTPAPAPSAKPAPAASGSAKK